MKKRFSTVRIPGELKRAVYQVIEYEGTPLFLVVNRAVEKFLNENEDVTERYRYRKYDEMYIKRDEVLPVYLTEELMLRVEEYKKKIAANRSNIVLQALENDCLGRLNSMGIEVRISYLDEH